VEEETVPAPVGAAAAEIGLSNPLVTERMDEGEHEAKVSALVSDSARKLRNYDGLASLGTARSGNPSHL
jgi:hypothetical protein